MKKVFLLMVTVLLSAGMLYAKRSSQNKNADFDDVRVKEKKVLKAKAKMPDNPAGKFVSHLGAGWNLGNTLDAFNDSDSAYGQGLESESCWGQPVTTVEMISAVHKAGFNVIRIPVTWHNHIQDSSTMKIDKEWMARVKEVVDYAIDEGMYVILNTHHDNISYETSYWNGDKNNIRSYGYDAVAYGKRKISGYCLDERAKSESIRFLTEVWKQIALEFAEYDEHLIFELMNEPRQVARDHEWWMPSDCAECKKAMALLTEYEEAALKAVRSVKGNEKRFVMIPGMQASGEYLKDFKFPQDFIDEQRLILSVHAYSPYGFAMYDGSDHRAFTSEDASYLDSFFASIYRDYVKEKKIPVIIGEMGASNKGNLSARLKWFEYFTASAWKNYGMPCLLWDNGVYAIQENGSEQHGYFSRKRLTWYFPSLIKKMLMCSGCMPGQIKQDFATMP
ncbi:glycoside hydrolase family 5 protein [Treponema sp.]|uniref:glycoside hydrolase family 5 protein n=1 Tax=Treponema sp. TaxID=166 RepID=UPI0025D1FEE5|nr:glycoside hydrolase family 5 protein [Treponema sp.]MCR5217639.1 glycoside hydrolase family 5 protein [Treponema sp.]